MKQYIAFLICCLFVGSLHAEGTEPLLLKIDSLILHNKQLKADIDQHIQDLNTRKRKSADLKEEYLLNKMIGNEYKVYISDSAMHYLKRNEEIALQLQDKEWLAESRIALSFIYAATGLVDQALQEMALLTPSELPPPLQIAYYMQQIYNYSHEESYTNQKRKSEIRICTDRLAPLITPAHEAYGWYLYNRYSDTDKEDSILEEIRQLVNKQQPKDPYYGNNTYALYDLYRKRGNMPQAIKYLTMAVYNDILLVNRDTPALYELIQYLCAERQLERSYQYMEYALDNQNFFKDRIRKEQIAPYIKLLFDLYQEKNQDAQQSAKYVMMSLAAFVLLLLLGLFIILQQLKRLNQSKMKLAESNARQQSSIKEISEARELLEVQNRQLKELNTRFEQINKDLNEVNYVKEEYIGYVFVLCSNYITQMGEYRLNINRKMKGGMYEEVLQMTEPKGVALEEEVKELYQRFDTIFLSIYPEFIADFNKLLKEDEPCIVHKNELLNTELRIYALIWLGIDSSSKIANFLHVSPQTVYNARVKIRNRARHDKEHFPEQIKALRRAAAFS